MGLVFLFMLTLPTALSSRRSGLHTVAWGACPAGAGTQRMSGRNGEGLDPRPRASTPCAFLRPHAHETQREASASATASALRTMHSWIHSHPCFSILELSPVGAAGQWELQAI